MSSYHVDARIRLKKAIFNFENDTWEVEGYINFTGMGSDHSIVSNDFTHKWMAYGSDHSALEKILENTCGSDLLGPQKTYNTLMKD